MHRGRSRAFVNGRSPFEDHRDALADTDAHRAQRVAADRSLKVAYRRRRQPWIQERRPVLATAVGDFSARGRHPPTPTALHQPEELPDPVPDRRAVARALDLAALAAHPLSHLVDLLLVVHQHV